MIYSNNEPFITVVILRVGTILKLTRQGNNKRKAIIHLWNRSTKRPPALCTSPSPWASMNYCCTPRRCSSPKCPTKRDPSRDKTIESTRKASCDELTAFWFGCGPTQAWPRKKVERTKQNHTIILSKVTSSLWSSIDAKDARPRDAAGRSQSSTRRKRRPNFLWREKGEPNFVPFLRQQRFITDDVMFVLQHRCTYYFAPVKCVHVRLDAHLAQIRNETRRTQITPEKASARKGKRREQKIKTKWALKNGWKFVWKKTIVFKYIIYKFACFFSNCAGENRLFPSHLYSLFFFSLLIPSLNSACGRVLMSARVNYA